MGPGPINADPRVLRAMAAPLIGQFDPAMTAAMNETMAPLPAGLPHRRTRPRFLVDGTARAGIEALLVSLIEPGDRVLVPVFGRFGHLLVEIAERCGAEVHTVEAPVGRGRARSTRSRRRSTACSPTLVATVQGDTSTTMCQPLAELGAICHEHGVLLYADVTASLGGNPLRDGRVGARRRQRRPPEVPRRAVGQRAGEPVAGRGRPRSRARKKVEAGIRRRPTTQRDRSRRPVIRSNYFDVAMLLDYWGERRLNHHTEATSMLYAALRVRPDPASLEGLDAAVERHRRHGAPCAPASQALGLELFGDQAHKMHNVVGVEIPAGVDGEAVRADLLDGFGIEIGTSFGPLHGRIWRIGTMGYNARPDAVLTHAGRPRGGAPTPRRSTGHRPSRGRRRGVLRGGRLTHHLDQYAALGRRWVELRAGLSDGAAPGCSHLQAVVLADAHVIRTQATVTRCFSVPRSAVRGGQPILSEVTGNPGGRRAPPRVRRVADAVGDGPLLRSSPAS